MAPKKQIAYNDNPDLLTALRAGNPDYNLSLDDAAALRKRLEALDFQIDRVGVDPVIVGVSVPFMTEDDLRRANIDPALPLNISFRFAGKEDGHNAGLIQRRLSDGSVVSFRMLFAEVYGEKDPWGRTAADRLLSLPKVHEAVLAYLAA